MEAGRPTTPGVLGEEEILRLDERGRVSAGWDRRWNGGAETKTDFLSFLDVIRQPSSAHMRVSVVAAYIAEIYGRFLDYTPRLPNQLPQGCVGPGMASSPWTGIVGASGPSWRKGRIPAFC